MLVDIESFLFNAFRNTQAMYLVQHFKDNEAHACRPRSYHGRTEELCQQEAAAAAWKSHSTLTLLATQNYPFLLKYDCPLWLK